MIVDTVAAGADGVVAEDDSLKTGALAMYVADDEEDE